MNEKAITLIVFFTTLLVFIQIKFIFRIRKIRKNSANLPGVLIMTEILDGLECCCPLAICFSATSDEKKPYEVSDYETKDSGTKITSKDEKIAEKYRVTEEQKEENKIKVLVHGMQTMSIETVCKMTKLTKKRVIEIITNNPNYIVVDDNLINLKMYSKEEAKGLKDILLDKICPNCENPFESGSDFCSNCGYEL